MAVPEPTLIWGLTWANIIAFLGIIGNFFFTYFKDKRTRDNASKLDTYNHSVRTPIETLLTDLSNLMDEADDIVLSRKSWQEQIEAVKALKTKFHASRRKMARKLTDCDRSERIRGNGWSALEQMDMDRAAESLEFASAAITLQDVRDNLHGFARSVDAFSDRLKLELDKYASSLV